MLIKRTADLVTPTPGVLAMDHSSRRRLACRVCQHGRSETIMLVVEQYGTCPGMPELGEGWWRECDAPVQCREERSESVRNRLGQPGAYCMVADIEELVDFAHANGMVWVAKGREILDVSDALKTR